MTSIHVPVPPPKSGASYKRISARCGVDIAAVGVGVMATFDGEGCKEAESSLARLRPIPMRAIKTEGLDAGPGMDRRNSSKRQAIRPPKKLSPSRM